MLFKLVRRTFTVTTTRRYSTVSRGNFFFYISPIVTSPNEKKLIDIKKKKKGINSNPLEQKINK